MIQEKSTEKRSTGDTDSSDRVPDSNCLWPFCIIEGNHKDRECGQENHGAADTQ